jgi:hypothetical protein
VKFPASAYSFPEAAPAQGNGGGIPVHRGADQHARRLEAATETVPRVEAHRVAGGTQHLEARVVRRRFAVVNTPPTPLAPLRKLRKTRMAP